MKYVILSPENKLICFEHEEQVKAYCMEKENNYLDTFCKDQELEYENMTPVEIGYAYVAVGAEKGGCKIFYASEIVKDMKEEGVEIEMIKEINELFSKERLNQEIECPSYLGDLLSQMTPMDVAEMVGEPYTLGNVDGPNREGMPWGV